MVTDLHYEYIAEANGFPFTVTEYTPDNTGRIRRQGGVGPTHQLGSNHETKYYYAVPEQEEIDRLFGNNVGYKDHYEKEMVVDPNGQVSISYKNSSGKVIATALAGVAPANVQGLNNTGVPESMTSSILNTADASMDMYGNTTLSKTFAVPLQGNFTFDYAVNIPRYTSTEVPGLCADCVYDLVISLKDECQEELLDGDPLTPGNQPVTQTLGKLTNNFDVDCESGPLFYSFANDPNLNGSVTVTLPIGSYTISKTIVVDENAVEYYADQFALNNPTLETEEDYITAYLDNIDYSQCDMTCDECEENLGDLGTFISTQSAKLQQGGYTVNSEDIDRLTDLYNNEAEKCARLCNGVSNCDIFLETLTSDITPGGQYAALVDANGDDIYGGLLDIYAGDNGIGFNYMYYTDGAGDKHIIDYQRPDNSYIQFSEKDEDGNTHVYRPYQFSREQFLKYFNDDIAAALVVYHPEYCQYEFCVSNETSEEYDADMLATDSYADAILAGYLNPTADGSINTTEFPIVDGGDPFWKSANPGASLKAQMQGVMNSFKSVDPTKPSCIKLSMWEISVATYLCPGLTTCAEYATCVSTNSSWASETCEPYQNMMWKMFRSAYLSEKQRLKQGLSTYACENTIWSTNKDQRIANIEDAEALIGPAVTKGSIENEVLNGMELECQSTCEAQADLWISKLVECNMSQIQNGTENDLRDALIEVCAGGCDGSNPLGASSVSPAYASANPTAFHSFEDVFNHYLSNAYVAGACDPNLISFPMKYGHTYTNIQDVNDCVSILNPDDECVLNETHPDLKTALLTIVEKDSGSCEKCIGCDELWEAVGYLNTKYSGSFLDDSENKEIIATKILNDFLDFNLTYNDYAGFASKCMLNSDTILLDSMLWKFYSGYSYLAYQAPLPEMKNPLDLEKKRLEMYSIATKSPWDFNAVADLNLLASSSSVLQVNAPPTADAPLKPCVCDQLQSEFDNYVANGGDPNDQAAFNMQLSMNCYEVTGSAPPFDFFSMLDACKEIYAMDGGTLAGVGNNWTPQKRGLMNNIVMSKNLFLPDCFPCSDPTPNEGNPWYPKYTTSGGGTGGGGSGSGGGPTLPPPHYVDCDSILALLDSLIGVNPIYGNVHDAIANFAFTGDESQLPLGILDMFKAEFYARFPHAYKDATARPLMDEIIGFLQNYLSCFAEDDASMNGCCYKKSKEAIDLEAFLNAMTATKGWLGNHFVYSGWNMHPDMDEYYDSWLYNFQSCSTSLISTQETYKMPTLQLLFDDGCANEKRLTLRYNFNNNYPGVNTDYYYGNITSFSNLKPVSRQNCDPDIHNFTVDIQQQTWFGTTIYTTLRGYAPDWVLMDTCDITDSFQLCDKAFFNQTPYVNKCKERLELRARYNAKVAHKEYIEDTKENFKQEYREQCREFINNETFTMTRDVYEYHYTLYYYDQAGNLVQTVPPAGVDVISNPAQIINVHQNRLTGSATYYPTHTLPTTYEYNSLNQLVVQNTPDGGTSGFWYDQLGRMIVSQNAEQAKVNGGQFKFSYTTYDALGRIKEVGQIEKPSTSGMYNGIAKSPIALSQWMTLNANRTEVTNTYYDNTIFSITYNGFSPENMRSRVVAMTYEKYHDFDDQTYLQGIHYSYDIHGNVNELIRENSYLVSISQNYKHMAYDYELVSGNVNKVIYQGEQRDQFIHKYDYDADNRLLKAYTTQDNIHYDLDAEYFYYLHGPLMRAEIGDVKVQGIDYAYTLHGWLKGVNSTSLKSDRDMGRDAEISSVNEYVAQDVFSFSLGYYEGDFTAIGTSNGSITPTNNAFTQTIGSSFDLASPDLFNGNIKHMVTAIKPFMGAGGEPQGMTYAYDQLNRIKSAKSWNSVDVAMNTWTPIGVANPDYETNYTYDANGNILSLDRSGSSGTNINMDQLTYFYNLGTNQLDHVKDAVPDANHLTDIDNQSINNYAYDGIGNMTQDVKEEIENIEWTVYGKIEKITRTAISDKADLEFEYTPDGHRSLKRVYFKNPGGGGISHIEETYYIRDASGNMMSTYIVKNAEFTWQSSAIYGSSRIGVVETDMLLVDNSGTPVVNPLPTGEVEFYRGKKRYEMSNHLGNVLTVVSDKRTLVCTNGTQHYEAEIIVAQDYYPFGMMMPERSYTATTKGYRFGFNGKEQDDEVNGEGNAYDFGARMYDSRLGRWMSVDAMKKPYFSSYQYGADNPMIYIDPDGNTEYYFNGKWIGSDGVNNNKIALVKSNKVKRGIKKGTYQYPDPKGITNGADNDEIFVIDKNVLQGAVDVLDKALKNGQDREFGLTLNKDEAGNFERTENGIVEGPVRPLDEEESGEVDQEKGDVIIHSHRTGLGKNGEHAIPEDPSPSDKSNMDEVEMSIIVGKGENGGKVGFDENDNIVDRRPSSGSINIFNKDNKDSPTRAIGGNQARNILNDHKKR